MALNTQLLAVQILIKDVQVLILCLSYLITTVIILYGPLRSLFMTSSDKWVASIHPLANSNGLHTFLKVKSKEPLKVSLGYHNFTINWTCHNPMLVIKDQCALCTLYTGASLLLRWHAKDPKDHGRLCSTNLQSYIYQVL